MKMNLLAINNHLYTLAEMNKSRRIKPVSGLTEAAKRRARELLVESANKKALHSAKKEKLSWVV